jgi:hypothetical protein
MVSSSSGRGGCRGDEALEWMLEAQLAMKKIENPTGGNLLLQPDAPVAVACLTD